MIINYNLQTLDEDLVSMHSGAIQATGIDFRYDVVEEADPSEIKI